MRKISKEEHDYHRLTLLLHDAKTDEEADLAKKNIDEFASEHPDLVDEIRSRRWLE